VAAAQPVRFCFDFISPYAYIAWTQIHAVVERSGRTLDPIPVLFAALLNAHGTVGPAEVPAKRVYAFKDAYRKAHHFGLPQLTPPPTHPFNPLLALRVASQAIAPDERRRLIDALFSATWAGGGGVDSPDRVAAIADSIGLDGPSLVRRAHDAESKQRLREQTESAIAAGVFGVPTALVDGEIFWGVDSLPWIETRLEGRDPLDPNALAQWAGVKPSASRR
jgi:2-hydroxychromene-2-carboxylate isomerase